MLIPKNNRGFTLAEVLVFLLVLSLLSIGIYSLILLSLKMTADNSYIVAATEIANQKMEKIRNLRYDDVGTVAGSPPGLVPEYETINRNGEYLVHAIIVFHDDPYDGTLDLGTDSIFVDYKIATIEVSWQGRFGPKKITVFSKIVPNTEETLNGYGLLKILTVDAGGAIVPNSSIHIENSAPVLNADYISDASGRLSLPLLPDFEGYAVTVTKAGYSTERTYARDATNLNPTKPHLSIFIGAKTEESFSIDRLASLNIRTVANNLPANFQVNAAASGDSLNQKIALDQSGNGYFVWQNNGAATSTVLAQKYNSANIKQWAADLKIATTTAKNPDIAVTKAGVSFITWQDNSVTLKQLAYRTDGRIIKTAKSQTPAAGDKEKKPAAGRKTGLFEKFKTLFASLFSRLNLREIRPEKVQAAANISIVQTKISAAVNNSPSITATFDATPAAGNVLIAIAAQSNAGRSFSAPTNTNGTFTVSRYSNSAWQLDTGIWHKIAGAGEAKAVTIASNGNINGGVLLLMEVSGLDTGNLLNVASANDQTGGTGLTAATGQTAASAADAFAVAAVAFADDDFVTPTSANWVSGSADSLNQRLWTDWSAGNDGSLAVATINIGAANQQSAALTLTGGGAEERNSVLAVFKALTINQVIVSAAGNQNPSVLLPQTDYYPGGNFVIAENDSARNVNSIKLREYGTVDAQTKISAVKLYYDLDISPPYDCASESYQPGLDPQFGLNETFDGPDGFAVFGEAGGVNITTVKTLCLYPVISLSGANNNETLDLKIDNPPTDVLVSSGTVVPASPVEINGVTVLTAPADVRQVHARPRKDDGDESGASWLDSQDTPGVMYLNENLRLRFEITNRGGVAAAPMAFRLEYGQLTADCDAITAWQAAPNDNSQDWKITDSSYFADSAPSANVANGLTDENWTFLASQLKDADNQTAPLTLNADNFTEMEFNLKPNAGAGDKSFCFRLSDQGDASAVTYEKYAVIYVKGDENIFLRAVNPDGSFAGPTKRVNAHTGDSHQTAPVIALTESLGVATTAVAWADDRDGNGDVYLQILDQDGNRQLAADLAVANSADNDHSPALAFDSADNLYTAWVRDGLSRDIYLSKFDGSGNLLLGPLALKAGAGQEYSPKISFDAADNLYLAYTEESGGLKKAKAAKYDGSLALIWDKNPNAEAPAFNQFNCRLGIYDSAIFAVWNDDRNGDQDVYAQKISAAGDPLWANDFKVNIGLDAADQTAPALAARNVSEALCAWPDYRDGGISEIYGSSLTGPEALVAVPNVPLKITGTKRIGENPVIYKYSQIQATDSGGNLNLQLDWDVPGYSVAIDAAQSSQTIILRNPPQPLNILPNDNKTMLIYVE